MVVCLVGGSVGLLGVATVGKLEGSSDGILVEGLQVVILPVGSDVGPTVGLRVVGFLVCLAVCPCVGLAEIGKILGSSLATLGI